MQFAVNLARLVPDLDGAVYAKIFVTRRMLSEAAHDVGEWEGGLHQCSKKPTTGLGVTVNIASWGSGFELSEPPKGT